MNGKPRTNLRNISVTMALYTERSSSTSTLVRPTYCLSCGLVCFIGCHMNFQYFMESQFSFPIFHLVVSSGPAIIKKEVGFFALQRWTDYVTFGPTYIECNHHNGDLLYHEHHRQHFRVIEQFCNLFMHRFGENRGYYS